ncbi:MAG: metallophosphoesterase [Nitrososphaeria archaeon]|nr:metallophosphoesterase [Nitrososphaeria archaeon]
MKVAAAADIHAPLYLKIFEEKLDRLFPLKDKVSLFLLAGDIVDGGKFEYLDKVNVILDKVDVPIFGCFGNNEYEDREQFVREKLSNVKFLNDEHVILDLDSYKIDIVGSRGVLDEPTFWQKKNVLGIEEIYRNRISKLKTISKECTGDIKILLLHYPPTLKILKGENPRFLKQMGSNRLEDLIIEFNVVIVGHAHRGLPYVEVYGTPVYNVSLPLINDISIINIEKGKGLDRFL